MSEREECWPELIDWQQRSGLTVGPSTHSRLKL